MKRKNQHPADIDAMAAIAQARAFTASLFLGAGKHASSPESPSLAGARHWGVLLQQHHGGSRRALVYALLPNGRSVHVPADYQPCSNEERTMSEIKSYSTRGNAQRAAKAALGGDAVSGADFVVYEAAPGQFAWKRGKSPEATAPAGRAAKTYKLAKPPKAAKAPEEKKRLGKRAAVEAAAAEGKLPQAPDFTAETHARYRGKLAAVVALVKAGDIRALKDFEINPCSTSPKAIAHYRDLCIVALEASARSPR